MSPRVKRDFWLVTAVVTAFPAILLVFGALFFNLGRLRSILASGSWPQIEEILAGWEYYVGYAVLVGLLGLASWFSYRNYTKSSGLDPADDE
jgi:hypothetical protein